MTRTMIDRLREVHFEERPKLLEQQYTKNTTFLKRRFPDIHRLFRGVSCPYRIDLTETFLNLVHVPTETLAHPEIGLDVFAEVLGDWVHDTWVDLFNFNVVSPEQYPIHHLPLKAMHRSLMTSFPEYPIAFAQRKINLKELPDDRRFSPPVIFLGVFHGLHIDYFLSRTEVDSLLLVEPEPERFEVSCYFLDYEELYNRYDRLMISIGDDTNASPIRNFFSTFRVTPQLWTRILPGYACEANKIFVEAFKMHQTTLSSVIFPIDHDLLGVQHAFQNLRAGLPLLSKMPKLSRQSKVVIIATGPSLDDDIKWLKKNRNKVLVFAVSSAVKPLLDHGIRPDIQFNLETEQTAFSLMNVGMVLDIPCLANLNANQQIVDFFPDNIYLCASSDRPCHVDVKCTLPAMQPSTTNFAFAFACACCPQEIYLLGCDFGYVHIGEHHSRSSIYKKDEEQIRTDTSGFREMKQVLVHANFGRDKVIQSNPFLSQARLAMEFQIGTLNHKIKVFNCSNGAKIVGAKSKKTCKVKLDFYKERNRDLKKILSSFSPAQEDVNYSAFEHDGAKVLSILQDDLCDGVILEIFDWRGFSEVIDQVLSKSIKKVQENKNGDRDLRMEIYSRYLLDLLAIWYSTMVFFDDQKRAAEVYSLGLALFTTKVKELSWVEGFESFEELKERIPAHNRSEGISWKNFLESFEKLVPKAIRDIHHSNSTVDRELYKQLLVDLVSSWYSRMIFTEKKGPDVTLCKKGLGNIRQMLTQWVDVEGRISEEEMSKLLLLLKASLQESA